MCYYLIIKGGDTVAKIIVCKLDTSQIESSLRRLYALSSDERKKKADTIKKPEKKLQSLAGGLLLKLLKKQTDCAFSSLSHSGEYCAAAASNASVGIDVERIRPVRDAVKRRVCTEAELSFLENSIDPERAFIELWTCKEAYFKAHGGASSLSTMRTACFATHMPTGYLFSSCELDGGYILTICEAN